MLGRSLSHARASTSTLSRRCGGCRCLALKSGEWIDGDLGYDTKLVHAGVNPDSVTGAILTPIYQSTTYVQDSVDQYLEKGFSYARTNNPTVTALEKKIAELEGGAGARCVAILLLSVW